ncbi:type II and III secretion system protein family protein [Gellertiella hungarica]|uniref:Pilus assembly protein CpaC n=1 Tax=Gellertiella hungarica TaxID=1572859 RepID=A0A7W6NMB4_9HYPH|nr:type II and III secretion system protein family protein [Gellertiella hungarica]MBB4066459.1 pilus assembly protein CpaC [Gellertiella hungarica]
MSLKKNVRSTLAGSLSFCLALSGTPGFEPLAKLLLSRAEAVETVIRIAQAGPGAHKRLKLGLNKAIVVDLPEDAHDILVSDPQMADAVTRTSRRIYLFGKTVGQTNIFIFGANGQEIVSLDLEIERDIAGLQDNLRRFIPDSNIKVEIISDNVVLTGTVRTPQDAAQAERLTSAFLKGGEATTRNQTVTGGNSNSGVAIFAEDRQQSQIVNLLTIEGEDQVTLKVTVAEVSRTVLKQLGFSGSIGGADGAITFKNPTNLGSSSDWYPQNYLTGNIGGLGITSYLNALEQAGVMRTLAEPSLTAISGEQAKFKVGGEFRLASSQTIKKDQATGELEISREAESTEYGVELNFRPVVLSPGRISLRIETKVSEPTFEGNFISGNTSKNIPGVTYLGLRKREASTSVELPSGGSIVIAGLVRDDVRQAVSGFPGLARVPILGTLFRSKDFQRNESEMVIIATPYLVRPVARSELSRPDDNFNPANDAATFFMDRVNKVYGRRQDAAAVGQYNGAIGYIYK